MTDAGDLLQQLFAEILDEVDLNPAFGERVQRILDRQGEPSKQSRNAVARRGRSNQGKARSGDTKTRPARRAPGLIEPFSLFRQGEGSLRAALRDLDVEQLKDVVAEHGMDASKLAMKWKARERLEDLIVTTVALRSRKGDAFRGPAREPLAADGESGSRVESEVGVRDDTQPGHDPS